MITTGRPESIVAAPDGAKARNLLIFTNSGMAKNARTSRSILAKKAIVPISTLYSVLITTEERLYQPKALPTSSASRISIPVTKAERAAPPKLPIVTAVGMATASRILCGLQIFFIICLFPPISIPATKTIKYKADIKISSSRSLCSNPKKKYPPAIPKAINVKIA